MSTPQDELPAEIVRQCCPYKSCTTRLYLVMEAVLDPESPTGASVAYYYRRESNDNGYWGPCAADEIRVYLADLSYLPTKHAEQ
ncbi:hypothetical protein IV500_05095 [Paeniglutamicibacter antarcticus]|uniref:Uncharacterized protein n=1 Tax=Arthrobacter terrae TaxID=2935737 RepID=A0A931CLR8_9MICC|nr:hypothetical protein [Arthrobacter terrae]MBG0738795.1 hypothetical protein [Arthrobacter terrae]